MIWFGDALGRKGSEEVKIGLNCGWGKKTDDHQIVYQDAILPKA
jgi:hypothetical protein